MINSIGILAEYTIQATLTTKLIFKLLIIRFIIF